MSDTNDDTAKAFGYLVIFLLLPAIMLAPSLYIAFVAQHYWQWFIEPSFAVACPPLFRMTGLVLLGLLLKAKVDRRGETEEEKKLAHDVTYKIVFMGLGISTFWALGWVVHYLDGLGGGY